MKRSYLFVFAAVMTVPAFAQGFRGGGTAPSILYPGTGPAGHPTVMPQQLGSPGFRPGIPAMPIRPGVPVDPSFGQRLGWTVQGNPYKYWNNGYYRGGAYPVIYPVWSGGFWSEPQTVVVPQVAPYVQPQSPPVVIINQGFQPETANPVVRDYSNTDLPQPGGNSQQTLRSFEATSRPYDSVRTPTRPAGKDDQPTLYLIAFRDQTVQPVLAYWVEGETLNYVSMKKTINRVSLSLVDRDLSKRLNNERNLEFELPEPR